jgi:sugar O-acyltransferase (sialic acid O-acetyltransferase NeuD family)
VEFGVKSLVIFGTGPIAELADFYFREDMGRHVVGFTVDASFREADTWLDRELVDFEDLETRFPPSEFDVFVALSYTGLNKLRRARLDAAVAKGYSATNYLSTKSTTFSTFVAAENQFVLEDNTIQPFASIGRNVTLWSGNHIGHHSTIAEDCFIASHVVVSGGVTIGPRSFIGVNVTIRDNVKIGADCVIGAGSLVLRDIPDGSVLSPGATEISKVPSHRLRGI